MGEAVYAIGPAPGDPKPDWNGDLKPAPLEIGFDYFFSNPGVNSYPPFVYVENHRVVGHDPNDPLVPGKPSPFIREFPEKDTGDIGGADEAHRLYDDEQVGTTMRLLSTLGDLVADENYTYRLSMLRQSGTFMFVTLENFSLEGTITPIPEPSSTALLGLGLLSLALRRRR